MKPIVVHLVEKEGQLKNLLNYVEKLRENYNLNIDLHS
jgi:hypothetical protein